MTIALDGLRQRVSISIPQAAEVIGISRDHAYDLNAAGKLPGAYSMGGRILVHVPTLLAALESMAAQNAPRPSTATGSSPLSGADESLPATGHSGRGAAR